ncbi:electron transfer flavoprotein subunit beta/FixA family protein [Xanthobacter aminoxidans]|uniref:electron transfer flavoprotein subunit beta/FixA family protein n=1 Tax=Xanthobacter aminoxidans TaxID=186280 RepID=UPI002022E11A|nr:electron transfer flavoprotein subunit beta/FixA family protein [Xanthobacter aminoxidans]MCL8382822.1 electron transfer flavoprotein subunit beta/FixA family protein [Xanthobacter aminoxidans]
MKILVPVKRVASLDDEFELNDDGRDVDPDFCEFDLNEFDEYALEAAVQIKEAAPEGSVEVVVLTIGPDDADDVLRKALAKGADRAIRVDDAGLEEADRVAIARVIAKVAENEEPGLVLCGAQSADQGNAQTGMSVAALLGWARTAVVSKLDFTPGAATAQVERELEGGLVERIEVETPAVLTIQLGINTPRYASLRSIKQANAKPIECLTPHDVGLADAEIGGAGALSRVRRVFVPERGRGEIIAGTPSQQVARLLEIISEVNG